MNLTSHTAAKTLRKILYGDFSSFIARAFQTVDPGAEYMPNWHIRLIAEHLEAVESGEITRLVVNMPPRALKSICISVAWPAWLLGHDPSRRILTASYAAGLSVKHSIDCRAVVQSEWYRALFPGVQLAHDQNEKHKFMTTARGYRIASSVGGTITGEGGGFLIVDDPLTPQQALSANAREHASQWFDHTFASRLDNKSTGAIVVVMQRLHAQDLTGHLLAKGGWEHLCLPMEAPEQIIHDFGRVCVIREQGEALHPERDTQEALRTIKREMGSYAYAAQYQQAPLSEEGSIVKYEWLKRFDVMPQNISRIVQSWDTAIKAESHHDASVCLTFAECEGDAYLLDAQIFRAEYPALYRRSLELAKQWKPAAVLIEDRASGQQLIQQLLIDTALPVIARQASDHKLVRLHNIRAILESGRLWLPRYSAWLADFERDLLQFPNAPNDDCVDALTQYFNWQQEQSFAQLKITRL